MSNSKPTFHTNGSSDHSSRSTTPESVADLPPQAHLFEPSDERVPTPFPLAQQPIDEPIGNPQQYPFSLSSSWVCPPNPLPLAMPLPSSRTRSPTQHAVVDMQPSNSGSSSISIPPSPIQHAVVDMQPSNSGSSSISIPPSPIQHAVVDMQPSNSGPSSINDPPPIPVTPTVIITDYPYSLSSSSSRLSGSIYGGVRKRLHKDRETNEATPSHSVASGLYQCASMVVPGLPEYEASSVDDLGVEANRQRRERREDFRFCSCLLFSGALIGAALFGHQMGHVYLANVNN